jgi:hypothetical protein
LSVVWFSCTKTTTRDTEPIAVRLPETAAVKAPAAASRLAIA